MTQNTVTMVAPQNSLMATQEAPVADGFQPLHLAVPQQIESFSGFGLILGIVIVLAAVIGYGAYAWFKKDRQHGREITFTRSLFR